MVLRTSDPEIFENTVASLVDMASILFAYQIGVYGFGLGFGVLYAGFDAFIVIWMRKPISRLARSINPFRLAKAQVAPTPARDTMILPGGGAILPLPPPIDTEN